MCSLYGVSSLILSQLFATGVVTGGNLTPVLLTPAANLPPVSTKPDVTVAKFVAGVVDTGGAP
jgi:hypothetical protein